ncbi:MAG: TIGR04282 family arsenosugar biosynthesis glycosyltransferase [Halieaceae bacterium]
MAEHSDCLLIQFARVPIVGAVKTRLIPALGEEGACQLHVDLLQHCCKQLLASGLAPVELWLDSEGSHPAVMACERQGATLRLQQGTSLGERMHHALLDGLSRHPRVVLVGSDCPAIDEAYLRRAFEGLTTAPVVFGEATDGGYVLIGACQSDWGLFDGVSWGSEAVLSESLANVEGLGWTAAVLPALSDIDRAEDLPVWQEYMAN